MGQGAPKGVAAGLPDTILGIHTTEELEFPVS
jgi:hypothetical protein